MENQKDAVIAVFGAANALAGLLLVFMGFVYTRGEGFSNINRGNQFKNVARAGVLPFLAMLLCAWFTLNSIQGGVPANYQLAMFLFRWSLVATGLYAVLVLFVYL